MRLDRERLAKLLGMIGSSFDAEALSAARRANELVHEASMTWREVLGQITRAPLKGSFRWPVLADWPEPLGLP